MPEARRNFASAVVGYKFFCIYGGVDTEGNYLNDICFLNMGNPKIKFAIFNFTDSLSWEYIQVQNDVDS